MKKNFMKTVFAVVLTMLFTSCAPDFKDYLRWYGNAFSTSSGDLAKELSSKMGNIELKARDTALCIQRCQEKENGPAVHWAAGICTVNRVNKDQFGSKEIGDVVCQYDFLVLTKKSKTKKWQDDAFCQVLFYERGKLAHLMSLPSYKLSDTYNPDKSLFVPVSFKDYNTVVNFIKDNKPMVRYVYGIEKKGLFSRSHMLIPLHESNYDIVTLKGWNFVKVRGSIGDVFYQIVLNILEPIRHIFGWFMWIVGIAVLFLAFIVVSNSGIIKSQNKKAESGVSEGEVSPQDVAGKEVVKAKEIHTPYDTPQIFYINSLLFAASIGLVAGFASYNNYKTTWLGFAPTGTEFLSGFCGGAFIVSVILLFVSIIMIKKRKLKDVKISKMLFGYLLAVIGMMMLAQPFGLVCKLLAWALLIYSLPFLFRAFGGAVSGTAIGMAGTVVMLENGVRLKGNGDHLYDDSGHGWTRNGNTFIRD